MSDRPHALLVAARSRKPSEADRDRIRTALAARILVGGASPTDVVNDGVTPNATHTSLPQNTVSISAAVSPKSFWNSTGDAPCGRSRIDRSFKSMSSNVFAPGAMAEARGWLGQ